MKSYVVMLFLNYNWYYLFSSIFCLNWHTMQTDLNFNLLAERIIAQLLFTKKKSKSLTFNFDFLDSPPEMLSGYMQASHCSERKLNGV